VTATEFPRVKVEGVIAMDIVDAFAPDVEGAHKEKETALIRQIMPNRHTLLNAITWRFATPNPLFH
jgi:hypothetical protein